MARTVIARFNYIQVRTGFFNLILSIPGQPIMLTVAVNLTHAEVIRAMDELNDVLTEIKEGELKDEDSNL